MIEWMANRMIRRKTKNLTRIPLFMMMFDYQRLMARKIVVSFYVIPILRRMNL